jgi:outer membrane protein OmpA-like peptidoglycan-associated protein
MPDHLKKPKSKIEAHRIKGEAIALWIPLCLAIIGIINTIFIAQSLPISAINQKDILPAPSSIKNYQQLQIEQPTNRATVESVAEKTISTASSLVHPKQIEDSNKAVTAANINPDDAPGISLSQQAVCPPLFFFTFATDSATPDTHNLTPNIEKLKIWLEQHPDQKVFIEGHTDASGPEEYNLLLSYRRTKTVELILLKTGLSKNQLITRAFGEQEPLQDQPVRSITNRRVSIRVESRQKCINDLINGDSN